MSSREWYQYLLNKTILHGEAFQPDGSTVMEPLKCPSELKEPDIDWDETWRRARLPGLTNDSRTFAFRLLHNIHTSQERQHRTTRNTPSPVCKKCQTQEVDNILNHTFTNCPYTEPVMTWLLTLIHTFDPTVRPPEIVRLSFQHFSEDQTLCTTWLALECLAYAWEKRKSNSMINILELKTELHLKITYMVKSRRYRDAGIMLTDALDTG